jgi:hypothetical protein
MDSPTDTDIMDAIEKYGWWLSWSDSDSKPEPWTVHLSAPSSRSTEVTGATAREALTRAVERVRS